MRSLLDVLGRVTGRDESSRTTRGRTRRRRGEASSLAPAVDEDSSTTRVRSRKSRPRVRSPSPLQEEEDDVVPEAQASAEEENGAVPEAQ